MVLCTGLGFELRISVAIFLPSTDLPNEERYRCILGLLREEIEQLRPFLWR